jgi:hypothetical protein
MLSTWASTVPAMPVKEALPHKQAEPLVTREVALLLKEQEEALHLEQA